MRRTALASALLALALVPSAATAAPAPQPPLDISKMEYAPIGHFKPGETLPVSPATACDEDLQPLRKGEIFNPSGKFNAFDNNVFEILCCPFRGPGDTTTNDPFGNGAPTGALRLLRGRPDAAARPGSRGAGRRRSARTTSSSTSSYYEETMKEILGDFGVTFQPLRVRRRRPGARRATRSAARRSTRRRSSPAPTTPTSTIVIGAHYDQTNDGPAPRLGLRRRATPR